MGLLLTDVIAALFPEHTQPGHVVSIRPKPIISSSAEPTHWTCSCGHADVLINDDLANAMRESAVTAIGAVAEMSDAEWDAVTGTAGTAGRGDE